MPDKLSKVRGHAGHRCEAGGLEGVSGHLRTDLPVSADSRVRVVDRLAEGAGVGDALWVGSPGHLTRGTADGVVAPEAGGVAVFFAEFCVYGQGVGGVEVGLMVDSDSPDLRESEYSRRR